MDDRSYELNIKRVLDSFVHNFGFANHQLESFEHYIHVFLPDIINEQFPINVHCAKNKILHRVFLDGFYFKKPSMSEGIGFLKELNPIEAHRRKQTYTFDVFVHITHKVYRGTPQHFVLTDIRKFRDLLLCKIPCMVGSSACHTYQSFDQPSREKGYFIINGYEKVMISQEHKRPNFAFVSASKGKYIYSCEVRCFHPEIIRSTSTLWMSITAEKAGCVSEVQLMVPFFKKAISLAVIFRLFGIDDINEMLALILGVAPSEKLLYFTQSILSHDLAAHSIYKTQEDLFDLVSHWTQQQHEKKMQDKKTQDKEQKEEHKEEHRNEEHEEEQREKHREEEHKAELEKREPPKKKQKKINNNSCSSSGNNSNSNSSDSSRQNISNTKEPPKKKQKHLSIISSCSITSSSSSSSSSNAEEVEKQSNLKKKRIKTTKNIFQNEFFPHCGKDESSNKEKMFFLGLCVRKLLRVTIGELPPDDIDDYRNKRCCTAGLQFALLTRQLMRVFNKTLHAQIFKNTKTNPYVNFDDFFKVAKISIGLRYACATGNWGIQKNMTNQSGVCQVWNDTNITSKISHLRQVNTPLSREGKIAEPRQLHETHIGVYCACETPEGKAVGLIHQAGLLTRIRTGYPCKLMINLLKSMMKVLPLQKNLTFVLLNGIVIGGVEDAEAFVKQFKNYRQDFTFPIDASISHNNDEISILVDAEDCFRPFIKLANLHKLPHLVKLYSQYLHLLWNQLLIEGVIEYINKDEEVDLLLAVSINDITTKHTHLELNPSLLLFGASAGVIPFPDYNQSARNIFQSAMGKQSLSVQALGFRDHMYTKTHVLNYGHKPNVSTTIAELIGYDQEPAGNLCVVAILIKSGYNQDDSVILNQHSVDRGLFRSTCFRTTRECELRHGTDEERFCENFDGVRVRRKRKTGQSKVESNGFVAPGTHVFHNEVIANKSIKYANGEKGDISMTLKHEEKCVVEQVSMNTLKDDLQTATFQFSSQRTPEMADKFSSRHGQKGVAGILTPSEDLIYTKDGIIPDIVINSHAIPSRMTLGHILESYLGKLSAIEGKYIDGTPFRDIDFNDLNTITKDHYGKEVVYCGKTGEQLREKVFVGVVYYQRLKHMVPDKIHSRRTGPNQILTRQPAGLAFFFSNEKKRNELISFFLEGRGKKGGFRFGEMEKNAMVSLSLLILFCFFIGFIYFF